MRNSAPKGAKSHTLPSFLKKQQKTAQMQGFRPGKVPFGMIKKMYGVNAKVEEIQKAVNARLFKFIEEEKLDVLGQPIPKEDKQVIDWNTQKDFTFQYEVGLSPEFDVKLTAKKKFTAYDIQPDENLIDKYVEEISMRYGTVGSGDVVEEKDIVVADIAELESGEAKENGVAKLANVSVEKAIKDPVGAGILASPLPFKDLVLFQLDSKGLSLQASSTIKFN